MRRYYFSWFLMLVCVSGVSHAQGWLEYINRTDQFIVNFPGKPQVRETTHRSAFEATFPARVYSVEASSGVYSVTVVDYRESERIHSERTDRTAVSYTHLTLPTILLV